jgi:hypothetical protein
VIFAFLSRTTLHDLCKNSVALLLVRLLHYKIRDTSCFNSSFFEMISYIYPEFLSVGLVTRWKANYDVRWIVMCAGLTEMGNLLPPSYIAFLCPG